MRDAALAKARSAGTSLPWLDIGPMLVFFVAFHIARSHDPNGALILSAFVFALAAMIALLAGFWRDGTVSVVLLASTVAIVGTAALSSVSGSKLFLFMRPTAINGGLGVTLLAGTAAGANPARWMLGRLHDLPDELWRALAIRWGAFLIGIAFANEVLWRTQTESVWINVKTFGFAPLTGAFFLVQARLARRAETGRQG